MRQTSSMLLVLCTLVGCGDVVRAPITVVVDTDRARALEEQGRLQELRVGVQGDRAELEKARGDLQEARRRLEDAATDPGRRAAAAAEVNALEARLAAAPVAGVSRAELDSALAASEQRLASTLVAELERVVGGRAAVSVPTTATASPSTSPPAEDARAIVAGARRQLAARQLVLADVVGGVARVDAVDAALAKGDAAGAAVAARALVADVNAVVIDRPLVRRRYERVSRAAAAAGKAAAVKQQLADATNAIAAEDFGRANVVLGGIEADLH